MASMFSKLRKKDKNELRRVSSNSSAKSVRSTKSAFKSLFNNLHSDDRDPVDPKEEYVHSQVSRFLKSNGLPVPTLLLDEEVRLSVANEDIFLPAQTRDDDDELIFDNTDDDNDDVTHYFAVVLTVPQRMKLSLDVRLKCLCKNFWPTGIPESKIKHETFQLGELPFSLSLQNYNMFAPFDGQPSFNEHVIPLTQYKPFLIDDVFENDYYKDTEADGSDIKKVSFPPGEYVYLLPISFPLNIPESTIIEHASINYAFDFNLHVDENKDHYIKHFINLIRSPPKMDVSSYNKPIYINKVWDDALNYEISFPKKFVTIGEQLQFSIRLIPLVKQLSITKVKVNILEKVSYMNKNLTNERFEVDVVKHKHGRPINLLEIRPDDARFSTFAAREEAIAADRLENNNLLTCSYVNEDFGSDTDSESDDDDEIIGPLHIRTYLTFMKPAKPQKHYKDNQFYNENPHLTDMLVHRNRTQPQFPSVRGSTMNQIPLVSKVNQQFIDGILPSATTNHIRIQHKLQLCLRVSRKTDKMHNYEVMIDTPIYFLNSCCTSGNIELPLYIDSSLPSFEEATSPLNSPMSSPIISPYEETFLSRTSTLVSNGSLYSNFQDSVDLVEQIDGLMLSNTRTSFDVRRGSTSSGIINNLMTTLSKEPPSYEEALVDEDEDAVDDLRDGVDLCDQ
jgi:hypothetical protein